LIGSLKKVKAIVSGAIWDFFFHLDRTLRLCLEFEAKLITQAADLSWRH